MTHQFIKAADFFRNVTKTVYLYKNVWKEKSTALLHSPRETDKTAMAIDIACSVAKTGREVVYVACERKIENNVARLADAPKQLSICMPSYDSPDDKTDYADLVISTIEEIVATTSIRTFVIDSVTRIAALSFGRNASAGYIMKRLAALQLRCKLSLLVISHDSTKSTDRALLTLADSEITVEPPVDDTPVTDSKKKSQPNVAARDAASSRHFASISADGACLAATGSVIGSRPQASR